MELLRSNISPLRDPGSDFLDAFIGQAKGADRISVATGYITVQSIVYYLENLKAGNLPALDLVVGMYSFELITKPQYLALQELARELEARGGNVRICTSFPFHGKVYLFSKRGKAVSAIVGSSNFSAVDPDRDNVFEVDILVSDPPTLAKVAGLHADLVAHASGRLLDWTPTKFRATRVAAVEVPGVEVLDDEKVKRYAAARTGTAFELPLKCTHASNLNVYFGKGRLARHTGTVRRRQWYEVEIIVGQDVVRQAGYPRNQEFTVVTDDGWRFRCYTGGGGSKNFRSSDNLTILGRWIKQRFEEQGLLKVGERCTEEMLKRYGRDTITLTKTTIGGSWYLDLSVI